MFRYTVMTFSEGPNGWYYNDPPVPKPTMEQALNDEAQATGARVISVVATGHMLTVIMEYKTVDD